MSFNFIEVALRHANHAAFLQIFQQLSSSGRGGEQRKGKETLGRQTCHTILATESNEVSKNDQSESTNLNSLEDFYTFFP